MKTKILSNEGQKTFAVVFDKGEEVVSCLTDFAVRERISAAHLSAIGALQDVTMGYFDRDRKDYKKISVVEQVEVLSLIGDIALKGDAPTLHAHVVIGKSDGTAHGGHLIEAHVWPTLEVILVESPSHLSRRIDEETGLALIRI